MMEFARKNGLQVDPGMATDRLVPRLVTEFTKNFFGSRAQSRTRMEAIVNHISSDPANASAFFKRIVGDVAPEELTKIGARATNALFRIAGRGSKSVADDVIKKAAGAGTPAESAAMIFSNPAALKLARSRMTKQEFEALKQSNIQGMISSASQATGKTGAIIDGEALKQSIAASRSSLNKHYGKETVDRLENLAVYAKAHNGIPLQFAESPITATAAITTAIAGTGVAGASTAIDPTGIAAPTVVAGTLAAAWIFNPRGLAGRWLTTGLVPKSAKVRAGIEAAASLGFRSKATESGLPQSGIDLAQELGGFGP